MRMRQVPSSLAVDTMTALLTVGFGAVWLAAGLVMAKVCAMNGRDDEPQPARVAVVCGHCNVELCCVPTVEQAALEGEMHVLLAHSEGASWTKS